MKHCGTKRIETKRLIIRRFVNGDANAMYENWASDSEVTKYLMWPTHSSKEVSQAVTNDGINSYEDEKFYQWAIIVKENGGTKGLLHIEIASCIIQSVESK
ncbi:MAG: GNAT family N-acetyltransferase [Lachnospiraceae bacterium]|nr:GNAT family N-acetyltransferase [Lachnospiraceae bacterium]